MGVSRESRQQKAPLTHTRKLETGSVTWTHAQKVFGSISGRGGVEPAGDQCSGTVLPQCDQSCSALGAG